MSEIDELLKELKINPVESYKTTMAIYRIFEVKDKTYCLSFSPLGKSWCFSRENNKELIEMLYMGFNKNKVKIIIKDILEGK